MIGHSGAPSTPAKLSTTRYGQLARRHSQDLPGGFGKPQTGSRHRPHSKQNSDLMPNPNARYSSATRKPSDGLPRATPSSLGIDADRVITFLDAVENAGLDVHGFMLSRNGKVAVEAFRWPYRADRPRIMHSATKSFAVCAIGLALDEGRLRLDDRVLSFFPELHGQPVSDWMARMTVEDLLTMRIGHESETSGAAWRLLDTSWTAEFFKIPLVCEPGTVFMYTSAASYALSAILSRVTGETIHDYLKPRLFQPLGISGETWDISPDGVNPGGNGLSVKLVDLLKLGILHAQGGMWEGQRVMQQSWIDLATRSHVETGEYGYHWWTRPNGTYSAIGKFVQMTTVHPAQGIVLAVMAAIEESELLFPFIEEHLWPACEPIRSHSDSTKADDRLAEKLTRWQSEQAPASWKMLLKADGAVALEETRSYVIAPNRHGVVGVEWVFASDRCEITLIDDLGRHSIAGGVGHWIEGRTSMPGRDLHHGYEMQDSPVVARAERVEPTALKMIWIFPETAFRDTVTASFDGAKMVLSREVNINGDARRHDDLYGTLLR
ncbi:serine hydrolase domain-containing protein [Paraburkholderia sp. ZP32-5]|uniref:serine hydrolase domain-containing protein n=1 Tax=Paraburkholderia sp. ZP32-5 TaxID=2883245 RepID=UPI001F469027|nr:serine hydrolase [Paraburkholderia sp. ZP32-5]